MTESTRDPASVPIPSLSVYINASFDELTPVLEQIAAGASDRVRIDVAGGLEVHRALRLLRVESRETLLNEGMPRQARPRRGRARGGARGRARQARRGPAGCAAVGCSGGRQRLDARGPRQCPPIDRGTDGPTNAVRLRQ